MTGETSSLQMKSDYIYNGDHLYIHIPFCRYRCDYCDFFTRTGVSSDRQSRIIQRITEQGGAWVGDSSQLTTVYIGGGTPSALSRDDLNRLLSYTETLGSDRTERTVELNPEDVTPTLLDELARHRVNRISLGVQTLSAVSLKTIGRHTSHSDTLRETLRGLETVASGWNGRWSADIIVAIPGTTADSAEGDIRRLMEFAPPHVSLYELGIEPNTVLGLKTRRGTVRPVAEDDALEQLERSADVLAEYGLRRYEISSFARPGDESRHNLAYWRMAPHLGIGPGAVGTYRPVHIKGFTPRGFDSDGLASDGLASDGFASTGMTRVTNTRSFKDFLDREDFGVQQESISRIEEAEELVMMGLRTVFGVDRDRFRRVTGHAFEDICGPTIAAWPDAFDLTDQTTVRLKTPAWNRLDAVLVDLFTDFTDFTDVGFTDVDKFVDR